MHRRGAAGGPRAEPDAPGALGGPLPQRERARGERWLARQQHAHPAGRVADARGARRGDRPVLQEVASTYADRIAAGGASRGLAVVRDRRLGCGRRGGPMKAAFGQPGFRRLFAGLSTSMLGDSIMLLVLSIWVKTLTGSSAMAGFTFFFMCIPAIFAPLVGAWLDRVRRKPLLVWGNIASAVAVLPLLLVRDAGDVWIIWTVAALYGVSFVVLPAGLNGLLKELMPEELLVDANSSLQTDQGVLPALRPAARRRTLRLDRRLGRGPRRRRLLPRRGGGDRHDPGARRRPPSRRRAASGPSSPAAYAISSATGSWATCSSASVSACWCSASASRRSSPSPTTSRRTATFVSVLVSVQGIGAVVGGLSSPHVVRRLGEVGASVLGLVLLGAQRAGDGGVAVGGLGAREHHASSASRCRSSSCPT